MNRRQLKTLLIAILLVMVLSACGDKPSVAQIPETAKPGDLVGLEDCTYKSGKKSYPANCGKWVTTIT